MNWPPRAPNDEDLEAIAEEFGREIDPLAKHSESFDRLDVDPFDLFWKNVLSQQNLSPKTYRAYRGVIKQWCKELSRYGRHPACPNIEHVESFVRYCLEERDNKPSSVGTKLWRLNKAYEYWQDEPIFPHTKGYNPIKLVLLRMDLTRKSAKDPPRITNEELSDILHSVKHIRDRTIILTQLKLGLRASELCNLEFRDIYINCGEIEKAYPKLGDHKELHGRPNSVYIGSRDERTNNKSRHPRVLPIDEELRSHLVKYLLTRPDSGHPFVFQSETTHTQMDNASVNDVWVNVFQPEYEETERHRGVTSHFGRHWFTTYWRVHQGVNQELVKYMRGDTPKPPNTESREVIDSYIHTYYEDIEGLYRERVFKFGL